MVELRELTVYSNGDSRKLSTWSNIPYFVTETVEAKGIQVHRVDLSPRPWIALAYNIFRKIGRVFQKNGNPGYFRSGLHFHDARRRIRRAVRLYPQSQAHLFLTFSFSATGITEKPSIQLCDWPFEYMLRHFEGREPSRREAQSVKRENSQIAGSDAVISLFQGAADFLSHRHSGVDVHYLGPVVNALCQPDGPQIVEVKQQAQRLLYVGNKKYLAGAEHLLAAFRHLKENHPAVSLDIVGMRERDFSPLPEGVRCHGYLDKDVEMDHRLFYKLLSNASVFVNTTPKWGPFSATLEAMTFYTPVILRPYEEFVATFGLTPDFGRYCEDDAPQALCDAIESVLKDPSYVELCLQAHEVVKDATWERYLDQVLAHIGHTIEDR